MLVSSNLRGEDAEWGGDLGRVEALEVLPEAMSVSDEFSGVGASLVRSDNCKRHQSTMSFHQVTTHNVIAYLL